MPTGAIPQKIFDYTHNRAGDFDAVRRDIISFLSSKYKFSVPSQYLSVEEDEFGGEEFWVVNKMVGSADFVYYPEAGIYDYDFERNKTGDAFTGIFAEWARARGSNRLVFYKAYYPKKISAKGREWGFDRDEVMKLALQHYDCPTCMKGVQQPTYAAERVNKLRSIREYKSKFLTGDSTMSWFSKAKSNFKNMLSAYPKTSLKDDTINEAITTVWNMIFNPLATREGQRSAKVWGGLISFGVGAFMTPMSKVQAGWGKWAVQILRGVGYKQFWRGLEMYAASDNGMSFVESVQNDFLRVTRVWGSYQNPLDKIRGVVNSILTPKGQMMASRYLGVGSYGDASSITRIPAINQFGIAKDPISHNDVRHPPASSFIRDSAELMIRIPRS